MRRRRSPPVDDRRIVRQPVDYRFLAEHAKFGEIDMHMANISPHGFMVDQEPDLMPGERLTIRLPAIGRIEAHLVWRHGGRAGFQFERLISPNDFANLIATLGAEKPGPP
ncbi:PilZ domain-containing protein [Novosphingobium guangzhouense]|uniref:PilZ domain-containing protein n=1 Tax=Novosphingobium guangzhouense TaxID=1850347 RepID=A0A2K2FYB0_9SPHN|nr:PilZ domain-containing protein [Novosphingobium guangzhouense]PNU03776.1 hypothetical protein A8V01_22205 [Novosphingobium guangzhouense]